MLDHKYILKNLEAVRINLANRASVVNLDLFIACEKERKNLRQKFDHVNQKINEIAEQLSVAPDNTLRPELIEQARQLRENRIAIKVQLDRIENHFNKLLAAIPNMTHPEAPIGKSEEDFVVLDYGVTQIKDFDFQPKDHLELGENLDLIDMNAGSRVTGHGFYFLKNEAVLLELALQRFALDILIKEGFTPVATPDLARTDVLSGTGYAPRGKETQIYMIEGDDIGLIGTSEITLAGMYTKKIFSEQELPLLLAGTSHCFRTEAGAHGKTSRGLYRVHQFTKVEMFAFVHPKYSESMHLKLLNIERKIFDMLGIPYRCIELATGDLGASAYRKFDLEAWMPGRSGGSWGEITSTSNCTDYQSRSLEIKYRDETNKIAGFVHTLNGTALAISRVLVAIFENYQCADGSILIPDVLKDFMGISKIERKIQRSLR